MIAAKKSGDEYKYSNAKERINQIGLSLLSSQLTNSSNYNTKSNSQDHHAPVHRQSNGNINDDLSLASLKHYLGTNASNHQKTQKPISINNLVFKDSGRYTRVLSAKPQKTNIISEKPMANFDLQIQPPSPVQFQSLQPDCNDIQQQQQLLHQKRLSPVSINNLSINGNAPQYFSQKRSSNILGLQQVAAQKGTMKQT